LKQKYKTVTYYKQKPYNNQGSEFVFKRFVKEYIIQRLFSAAKPVKNG